ncbi:hypothetical protein BJF78_09715 [Pseudonocardia sp. CNS-139]|nr:hypothetical protein BJF78_09715 [Pseudonocardia sp. CNS-139]
MAVAVVVTAVVVAGGVLMFRFVTAPTTVPGQAQSPSATATSRPAGPTEEGRPELGPPGRIALSSDGNQHDPDDWAGAATELAILAHAGLQPNVVHYTYDDHIWDTDESMRANMRDTVLGGGEQLGFDMSRFYDAAVPSELDAGVRNLTAEIDASTADDQLWLVMAGPMEVAWMALDAAEPEARQHVKCVTHGDWNMEHGRDDHGGHDFDDLIEMGCQDRHLEDQNSNLGETDMSDWDYLLDGDDDQHWLHSRIELLGNGDVSDAGWSTT